MHQAARMT